MGILRRLREWREDKDGTLIGPDIEADSVNTEQLSGNYYYAGSYAGADPDARLDNLLSSVDAGSTIYLEAAEYNDARTISDGYVIKGSGPNNQTIGTRLGAKWTIDARCSIYDISVDGVGIDITSTAVTWFGGRATNSTLTVSDTNCMITHIQSVGLDILLDSNSKRCVVDDITKANSITDNGTNNVIGDIV